MADYIRTKLMKNRKPVIITNISYSDYGIPRQAVCTQVKVLYPNGDTEYCSPDEIVTYDESWEFK